jgi:hypothetical protein
MASAASALGTRYRIERVADDYGDVYRRLLAAAPRVGQEAA